MKDAIASLRFDEVFRSYSADAHFFLPPGKEHYRLLAYLSTQFDSSNLLDVGTSTGHSALALSYNKTNQVHTFDIVDILRVRNVPNVTYHLANLWKDDYADLILSCPLIFLDVDPHNGVMELEFYKYLKTIGYKGTMICDDIHYFEGMRAFWSQIPDHEKEDLTPYGHWSGTGLIRF